MKKGKIDKFDEAHYSSSTRPPGPQQLINAGYSPIDTNKEPTTAPIKTLPVNVIEKFPTSPPNRKILVKILHEDAVVPVKSSTEAAGYNICSHHDLVIPR